MFKYLFTKLNMGGYGAYVWPCYALLLLLITWQIYSALKKNVLLKKNLAVEWSGSSSDQQT